MVEPVSVEEHTAVACAEALASSVQQLRRVEAERFARVARWADLHPPGPGVPVVAGFAERVAGAADVEVAVPPERVGGVGFRERAVRLGGEGTPAVAEFAAVELGMLLQTSTYAATTLLRDALEVRHRLPAVWAAAMAGEVDVWKARRAASATRVLDLAGCREVDPRVAAALTGLPFGRAESVVAGLVVAADPAGHERRRRVEAERRYVAVGRRPNPEGLRTLVAQTTAGDVARLEAMVQHLADLAERTGDRDSLGVRRAEALALLADPARACLRLAQGAAPAGPAEEDPASVGSGTAVELGVVFGRLLAQQAPAVLRGLRPRTVLYVHLAEEALGALRGAPGTGHPGAEVARVRELGAVGLTQLREWLGDDVVQVRPVLDLAGQRPLEAYEIPPSLAESLALREPFEVFPWGTAPTHRTDLDHTQPWRESLGADPPGRLEPPGQTGLHNLGPLSRHHHRAKTFGSFRCYQPLPGLYLWASPSGHWFRVDHTGTRPLGRRTPTILRQLRDPAPLSAGEQQLRRRLEYHLGA